MNEGREVRRGGGGGAGGGWKNKRNNEGEKLRADCSVGASFD